MIARGALARLTLAALAGCLDEALYRARVNEARERWRGCADEWRALEREGALDAFENARLSGCIRDALHEARWGCSIEFRR